MARFVVVRAWDREIMETWRTQYFAEKHAQQLSEGSGFDDDFLVIRSIGGASGHRVAEYTNGQRRD